jgi:hypothetical protein
MKPLLTRHSRVGGNPVNQSIPREAEQRSGFVRYADVCPCWIPACAGMTQFVFVEGI